MGGMCAHCAATTGLEVDHIKRDTRTKDYKGDIWQWSRPRIEAELKHCQLLCKPCHIKKSVAEDRAARAKLKNPPVHLRPHSP